MHNCFRLFSATFILLAVAMVLGGCTITRPFTLPEALGEQGLLVGKIATDDFYPILDSSIVINGKYYGTSMESGFILLALEPGQYSIEKFASELGNTRYTYSYQRKFTIEAGKVTNLGLMLFEPLITKEAQDDANRYGIYLVDNSREMTTFLQEIRPNLYASLRSKEPILAPGNYLPSKLLNQLRYNLAVKRLKNKDGKSWNRNTHFVAGPLGLLAKLTRDNAGVITAVNVIETNTLADLSRCQLMAAIACLVSTREYITVKDDKVTRHGLPAGVAGNSLVAFTDTTLTLVDNSMNIYASIDGGKIWKKYDKAAYAQPLDTTYREADPKHRFSFFVAPSGYYIFPKDVNQGQYRLVYADYLNTSFRNLNVPDSVENIARLQETYAGVYFWPNPPGLTSSRIYVLPKGKTSWETRDLPQFLCQEIGYPDSSGSRIQLSCNLPFGSEKIWESKDGGLNWAEIPKASSMFRS